LAHVVFFPLPSRSLRIRDSWVCRDMTGSFFFSIPYTASTPVSPPFLNPLDVIYGFVFRGVPTLLTKRGDERRFASFPPPTSLRSILFHPLFLFFDVTFHVGRSRGWGSVLFPRSADRKTGRISFSLITPFTRNTRASCPLSHDTQNTSRPLFWKFPFVAELAHPSKKETPLRPSGIAQNGECPSRCMKFPVTRPLYTENFGPFFSLGVRIGTPIPPPPGHLGCKELSFFFLRQNEAAPLFFGAPAASNRGGQQTPFSLYFFSGFCFLFCIFVPPLFLSPPQTTK